MKTFANIFAIVVAVITCAVVVLIIQFLQMGAWDHPNGRTLIFTLGTLPLASILKAIHFVRKARQQESLQAAEAAQNTVLRAQ